MRLLLDTHALLWGLTDDARLSTNARRHLLDPAVEPLMSAASVYEVGLKFHLGKLALAAPLIRNLRAAMSAIACRELAISIEHAERAAALDLSHRDPFDRLLAAQALAEGVPIVSVDPAFDRFGVTRIW